MHVEGRWQRQVFLEQPDELLVQWPQVYGVHRKLAVASDNGDFLHGIRGSGGARHVCLDSLLGLRGEVCGRGRG
jgi:hypothetical protein